MTMLDIHEITPWTIPYLWRDSEIYSVFPTQCYNGFRLIVRAGHNLLFLVARHLAVEGKTFVVPQASTLGPL